MNPPVPIERIDLYAYGRLLGAFLRYWKDRLFCNLVARGEYWQMSRNDRAFDAAPVQDNNNTDMWSAYVCKFNSRARVSCVVLLSCVQHRRFEHGMLYQLYGSLLLLAHSLVCRNTRTAPSAPTGRMDGHHHQIVCLPCRWKSSKLMHRARSTGGDGAMLLAFSDTRSVGWISGPLL